MTRLLALFAGAVAGYLLGYRVADQQRSALGPPVLRMVPPMDPEIQTDPRLWHANSPRWGTYSGGTIQ